MKKILLTMAFVLTALGNAWADEMTVENITIPQQNTATLTISFSNSVAYRQLFSFKLELPEGITPVANSQVLSSRFGANGSNPELGMNRPKKEGSEVYEDYFMVVCNSGLSTEPMTENSGEIMTVQLLADASLTEGTVLEGKISEIKATRANMDEFTQDEATFQITIGAPLDVLTLDETSDKAPSATTVAKDVIVNRTIKPNVWSTICLPFDMTEAQVNAAFGEDVELADLTSWSVTGELPEVDKINLVFSPVKRIVMHHPYLIRIKGSEDMTSFTAKNVKIFANNLPAIEVPFNNSGVNCKCAVNGTYRSRKVPKDCFFMNNETFWKTRSDELSTTIKGFRAYFKFTCTMEEYDEEQDDYVPVTKTIMINETNESRISFSFNDDATKIKDISASEDDGSIYNLSGQKVERLNKKGLFIKGGKKVVIK